MRVVLVGRPSDRDRLRAELVSAGLEIAGEAASIGAAREDGVAADAFVVAAPPAQGAVTPPAIEALTPRELEVLRQLALGLANRTIAGRLGISDQTVKFHVASILGKLGAANRTDAVRRAARRGFVDL